jgi:3-methyladenine DNA glycosylase Tag
MEAPKQIEATKPADYLEVLSRIVFATGISGEVVDRKWPGIREAMHDFDAERIANMTPEELDKLTADPRVIRNRRKLEGIVSNAQTVMELEKEHGGFRNYLKSFGSFEAAEKDLKKRFKFVGDYGAYHFMYVVKEPVPDWHDWCRSHGREHFPAHDDSKH